MGVDYLAFRRVYRNDLLHYGKGHDDNPPGRGSGRYPYGSSNNEKKSTSRTKKIDSTNKPEIKTSDYSWGSVTSMKYTNNNNTEEKKNLDKLAKEELYDQASEKFEDIVSAYDKTVKEKGSDAAIKELQDSLNGYSWYFSQVKETFMEGDYTTYELVVNGNDYYFRTFGDGNYFDDQAFGRRKK